jgi:hypothetical protein
MLPPNYTYPDGTKSSRRPKDGEFYVKTDPSTGAVESTWQWDDVLGQWFNTSSGKPNQHNTKTFVMENLQFDGIFIEYDENKIRLWGAKCQCGSEAVGSPKHSHWCDKFDPTT